MQKDTWLPAIISLVRYILVALTSPPDVLRYYDDSGKLRLTRVDSELDYQYGPKSPDKYPVELAKPPRQKVVWEGKIEARTSGRHTFALYASDYHKLYVGRFIAVGSGNAVGSMSSWPMRVQ
jgi:hypothetical protein